MYWQIIIQDKSNLTGKSVAVLVKALLEKIPCEAVQVCEFEGAADQDLWLDFEKERTIKISKFLEAMGQVIQVDWGTFCLLIGGNIQSTQTYLEKCFECLKNGGVIIRCVDGEFFYIYTEIEEVSLAVQKDFQCLSVDRVDLQSIEWPE